MMRRTAVALSGTLTLGVTLCAWLASRPAARAMAPPNCGVSSVLDLARLLGRPLSAEESRVLSTAYSGSTISLLETRDAAAGVGLPLRGIKVALSDLASSELTPAIVHLSDPDHFVVIARVSPDWVQVLDSGSVSTYPRSQVEKRFTQQALVPERPSVQGPAPRALAPDFHYQFTVSGPGQEVVHQFACANAGDRDLTLTPQETGG